MRSLKPASLTLLLETARTLPDYAGKIPPYPRNDGFASSICTVEALQE
jgi:hypothetical protein